MIDVYKRQVFRRLLFAAAIFLLEGGYSTATTYIRPYKVAAGKTAIQTMEDRFAYGLNPKKLGAVSAYLCDPASAPAEFLQMCIRDSCWPGAPLATREPCS